MKEFIENINIIFENIKNQTIQACWRRLSVIEQDGIPDNLREEEADGNTYLQFSSGLCVGFYPNSELYTVEFEVLEEKQIPKDASDVSKNDYWQQRVAHNILDITLLYGATNKPYGVKFNLQNHQEVQLLYVSESEFTFDALIVR